MTSEVLILYTRQGCCLCQSLEERLRSVALKDLEPSLSLSVLDIDGVEVTDQEKKNYSLQVPIMVINSEIKSCNIEIPRVSPRLKGDYLFSWLQKILKRIY